MPTTAGQVTATPNESGGRDVSETLNELERKLRELESQLSSSDDHPRDPAPVRPPAPPAPPARPIPDAAARPATGMGDPDRLVAEARARLSGVGGQVDELLRFREQLQRTARELEDEYSRVLARIGAGGQAPARPATDYDVPQSAPPLAPEQPSALTPPPPVRPPVPGVGVAPETPQAAAVPVPPSQPSALPPTPTGPPPAAPAAALPPSYVPPAGPPAEAQPEAPAPVPEAAVPEAPLAPESPHEDTTFDGPVSVDVGPFTDIAALSAFEQSLARVPGAEDVYVSGFEGHRALVELRLRAPVALVREMRAVMPAPFTVAEAAPGRLRIDVQTATGG